MRTRDFSEFMREELKDPEMARAMLKDALEDDDPRLFLRVLRDVAKANNFSKIVREIGINRQAAYTSLSEKGNPGYLTVRAILNALDLDISVRARNRRERKQAIPIMLRPEIRSTLLRCRELALERAKDGPGAVYEAILDTALADSSGLGGPAGACYLFFDELGEYLPIVYSLTFADLDTKTDNEIAEGLVRHAAMACAYSEDRILSEEPVAA